MSTFKPTDFTPLLTLTTTLLHHTKTAPRKYLDLQPSLYSLRTQLTSLSASAAYPLSILQQRCADRRAEWLSLSLTLHSTLSALQTRIHLASRSKWTRFFRRRKTASLRSLKSRLSLQTGQVQVFVESIGLGPIGRLDKVLGHMERLLLEEVREERMGMRGGVVLDAYRTGDARAWRDVGTFLVGRGIDEEDVWRWEGRLSELVQWVVKNEPEITAVQEEADEDLEAGRSSMALNWREKM